LTARDAAKPASVRGAEEMIAAVADARRGHCYEHEGAYASID